LVQASGNRITTFDAYAEMGLPADLRRYDAVASIFAMLGVRGPLRLLTNNPEKIAAVARVLEGEKIEVDAALAIAGRDSAWNRDYLRAKRLAGHALERADRAPGARPPEPVRAFRPVELEADPTRLVTASYFLPIALPIASPGAPSAGVDWVRASVLVDEASGRESIVLSRGAWSGPEKLVVPGPERWIALSLLDRLPVASAPGRESLARALAALRAVESGAVGVEWDEAWTAAEPGSLAGGA